ncbi:MAG: protein-glutamate O-methyltransferase CheR [Oscillospiraceae bacterium]|nr:protein-glutamate O-methyltransferase CheR [Oscillospiraceae bacterium]
MDIKSLQCSINEREFILFRDYIKKESGIVISPEKAYLIETRLSKLMLDAGAESFGEYYDYIVSGKDPAVSEKIINAITVNETLWFRDASLWKLLDEEILPGLVEGIVSGKKTKVRVWCAAVSTGQEVYSAAMRVDEYLNKNKAGAGLANFEFFATDISGRVLDIAKNGRYDKISMTRGIDEYYKTKYFTNTGSVWDIDPKIKNAVKFERFNLQKSYGRFGLFDIIFCRYVLIYFSNETKTEIIKKMRGSLTDDGVFFTGNYVFYDLFKDGFESKHYDNITYYQKKGGI